MKKSFKFIDYAIIFIISIQILIFILYPFLRVFIYSFFSKGNFSLEGFMFLKNSKHLIINSLYVAISVTVLTIFISISIAIFCYITNKKIKNIISFILMLTMISPPFVSALSYIKLFGRRGFITYNILQMSVDIYGATGIIFMQSISLISLSALIIISSLDNVDKSQINSARSLGAKTNNVIVDILLPELKSSIKVVSILAFIRSLADFSTPLIIGGAYETLASRSYLTFISEGDILQAGAMNVILCIPVVISFIFYIKYSKMIIKTNKGHNNSELNLRKNGIIFYVSSIFAIIFLLFIFLQYVTIILSAFIDYNKGKMVFTLAHIKELSNYTNKTIFRSIYYSLIAAFWGSVIGMLLQYYIVIRNKKYLKMFDLISTIPYVLPGTFFGIGYILSFNKEPLNLIGTTIIVILNVTFKQLPFSTKIFNISMTNIDKNEILSGKDLGANEFYIFKDIVFPNSLKEFFVSLINNFNATMTTVGSIIFIVYPRQKVLTLVMFDVINSGKYEIASAIALLIIVICILFNFIFLMLNYILKKGGLYVFKS